MKLLPWQRDLAASIQGLIRSERFPHAALITGPEGWGEVAFAQWLALRLLELPEALDVDELAHPDLRWVKPDGAEIKVAAVREVAQFAFTTSRLGARKVVVLEDAHLLNRSAANALLKTLEEPPPATFVVLCSSHPGRLLPTIRSRCQRFTIQPDSVVAWDWLSQGAAGPEIQERLLANGGAPLLVAAEVADNALPLVSILERILESNQPRDAVEDLLARDARQVTGGWYRYIQSNLAQRDRFGGLVGVPARALFRFADELLWVRHQLLETNSANARLLLERLVVRWHDLGPSRPRHRP